MFIERLIADISLPHKPKTGKQAYDMLLRSLKDEIKEKQDILSELDSEDVKQRFIENWNPSTRSVNIYNI